MSKEISLKDAKCTGLSWNAPVQLKQQNEEAGTNFSIEAYTGEVVDRWWGKLAISVDGIKAKNKIPVLLGHVHSQIVGYSTKTYKDGSFFVDGKFSGVTQEAEKVKGLADEGFPWQASIGVRPIKILSIEKGGNMKVNGKKLNGPAEVWLESQVSEVSFVALGADGNTSVSTFSRFEKFEEQDAPQGAEHNTLEHNTIEQGEENSMKITLEQLEKDAPELLTQIRTDAKTAGYDEGLAAGVDQERERVTKLMAVEDADPEARGRAITEGLAVDAAYKIFFEAEKKKKDEGLEELLEETPDSAGQSGKKAGQDSEETFMDAVLTFQKEKGCTRTEALKAVATARPALHQAFIKGK